jgi:hypothetical protein
VREIALRLGLWNAPAPDPANEDAENWTSSINPDADPNNMRQMYLTVSAEFLSPSATKRAVGSVNSSVL